MEKGWIKIHRSITDKGWFYNSEAIHLWLYLLLKANHCNREVLWNGKIMILESGKLITGRKKISDETGIQESKVERLLKMFESEQQIEQQKTNTSRLISIVNYSKFQTGEQQNEQQVNNKRTTNEQRVNTNKELKNKRNKELKNKNISSNEFDVVSGDIDLKNEKSIKTDLSNDNISSGGDVSKQKENATGEKITTKNQKESAGDTTEFKKMLELYDSFCKKNEIVMRITASDGKAMKEIIAYLKEIPAVKSNDKDIYQTFEFILNNFGNLDKWMQTQTQLRQINSQLPNIINQLKTFYNGKKITTNNQQELQSLVDQIRNRMEG